MKFMKGLALLLTTLVVQVSSFNVDNMANGLQALANEFAEYAGFAEFASDTVPLSDVSLNELYGESGGDVTNALDFSGFIDDVAGQNLTPAQIVTALTNWIERDGGTLSKGPSTGSYCGGDAIAISDNGGNLDIEICAKVPFVRRLDWDGEALFANLDEPYSLTSNEPVDVIVYLTVGAKLTINAGGSHNIDGVDPFEASFELNTSSGPSIKFGLGMIALNAPVTNCVISASWIATECDIGEQICSDLHGIRMGGSNKYLKRTFSYDISGDFPDISLTSSFSVTGSDAYNPVTTVAVTDVDDETFLSFKPSEAVDFLRVIDSGLVRVQEQDTLQTNLPFTETTFGAFLATGSVLTTRLVDFFVRAKPFENRGQQSLRISSSGSVADLGNDTLADLTYELWYLEGELTVNPTNYIEARELPDMQVCSMSFTAGDDPADDDAMVTLLTSKINDASCGVIACGSGSCLQDPDTKDFYSCNCDVVVYNTGDAVEIASVAHKDLLRTQEKDVQLLGIFETPVEAITEETTNFGLTLNQPAFPTLQPVYSTLEEFVDLMALALHESVGQGVTLSAEFVAATEDDAAEILFHIGFTREEVFGIDLFGTYDVGDLVDINVQADDAQVDVTMNAVYNATFGVLLAPDPEEQIVVLAASPCNVKGDLNFYCDIEAFDFNINYLLGTQNLTEIITVPAGTNVSIVDQIDAAFGDLATAERKGPALIVIKMDGNIPFVNIQIRRDCKDGEVEDDDVFFSQNVFQCANETWVPVFKTNSYDLKDQKTTKPKFQLGAQDASIEATFEIAGTVSIISTLGGALDLVGELEIDVVGELEAYVGNGTLIDFSSWLYALTAADTPTADGYTPNFLNASAVLNGTFAGLFQAGAPFADTPMTAAEGGFANPFVLDLLDLDGSGEPEFDFNIDIPGIGNLKKISFADFVGLFADTMDFIIGDGEDDALDSCTGGLLGSAFNDKSVFRYQIPVMGYSVCGTARFLQVLFDASSTMSSELESSDALPTFSTLEIKLRNLLEDGLGGTSNVVFSSSSSAERSDMMVQIDLSWPIQENYILTVDLKTMFEDKQVVLPPDKVQLRNFIQSLTPPADGRTSSFNGAVSFQIGLGLEYSVADDQVYPYILGDTGFNLSFVSSGDVYNQAQAGSIPLDLDVTYEVTGKDKNDDFALSVGLDPAQNYFFSDPGSSSSRENFVTVKNITELANELTMKVDGAIEAGLELSSSLIQQTARIEIDIADVDLYFQGDQDQLTLAFNTSQPGRAKPTFLQILLLRPQTLIDALNAVFESAEAASLGPEGIVTTFPIPFIRNGLGSSLGAGTNNNILAKGKRKVVPALQSGLDTYEGKADTVGDVLAGLMEREIDRVGLLRRNSKVTTDCFYYNATKPKRMPSLECSTTSNPASSSLMWTLPFGQSIVIELPLDFDLEAGSLPLEIEFEGNTNSVPTLEIGWQFTLAFGFDDDVGFFLFTFPGSTEEFRVFCLLSVLDRTLSATLFFLKGELSDLDLRLGVAVYVDVDKDGALGTKDDKTSAQFGRMTRADLGKIVKPSKLFKIGALAGATLQIFDVEFGLNYDIFPAALQSVKDWIPSVGAEVHAQARKQTGVAKDTNPTKPNGRMLNVADEWLVEDAWDYVEDEWENQDEYLFDPSQEFGELTDRVDHPAHPLLRSLQKAKPKPNDILDNDFNLKKCKLNLTKGETFCLKVDNLTLIMRKLAQLITPILDDFVAVDESGMLDKIMDPTVLFLGEKLPGISDIVGKPITILDIVEALLGPKSGAPTVRLMIKIYLALKDFARGFAEQEGLLIASSCDVLKGFSCTGGVIGLVTRRRLHDSVHSIFEHEETSSNLPTTPLELVNEERNLNGCPASFNPPACAGECKCVGVDREKCRGKQLACKSGATPGLSFPFMSNLIELVGLLQGNDINILRFIPPDLIFAFQFKIIITVWTPPDVNLEILFEFTIKLKLGFNLDSKGIREAVEQKDVFKALNSFALIDKFKGVDLAMITATATIQLSVTLSVVFIKIGVGGGLTIKVTIDLYDAYPATSKGLVRPYELLSIGPSPLDWFEFKLEIFVFVFFFIKVGIFIGPIEITLFKIDLEFKIKIFTFEWNPDEPAKTGFVEASGTLRMTPIAASIAADPDVFDCTTVTSPAPGLEDIECIQGDNIQTFFSTKKIVASGSGDILFRGVQSQVDLTSYSVDDVFLDYKTAGTYVIADNTVIIQANEIKVGTFLMTFNGMTGDGVLQLPQPEQVPLTATFTGGCDSSWVLEGHANIIVLADKIESDCTILSYGGEATHATLEIDFGFAERRDCEDGNEVILEMGDPGFMNATIIRPGGFEVVVTVADVFDQYFIYMSACKDIVRVRNTHMFDGFIDINMGGDNDEVYLGQEDDGVDSLWKPFAINGGSGFDMIQVHDGGSNKHKTGVISPGSILGLLNGVNATEGPEDIDYQGFETINVFLSAGVNDMLVPNTAEGSTTNIHFQDADDTLQVNETMGDLNVWAGGGADKLTFYGLGNLTVAKIWGEAGDDTIWTDGTKDFAIPAVNTFEGSRLRWSGGDDDDTMHSILSSAGNSDIDLFDDLDGVNDVNVDCAQVACYVLSRENFIASILNMTDPESSMERINLIREKDPEEPSGWSDTASINTVVFRLNGGLNEMYFDDTFAPMDVFGGPLVDEFYIGQVFNSERTFDLSRVDEYDPIETAVTTKGYLSNGNSHPVSISGGDADDFFHVSRNRQLLDLNGNSGNDTFIVRSFIHLAVTEGTRQRSLPGPSPDTRLFFSPKEDDPDYVINSLVDIDGGTWDDRMLVIGTEADDSHSLSVGSVRGGGLTIAYRNTETLEVTTEEDNDLVYLLGTGSDVTTYIYEHLGTDGVLVTPRDFGPVVSHNLRGHRGIIAHIVSSDDPEYDGLFTSGVSVDVLDNDGDYGGYVNVVVEDSVNLMTQDGDREFYFTIYPTGDPGGSLTVNLVSQCDFQGNRYVFFNDYEGPAYEVAFSSVTSERIKVTYNTDASPLDVTDENVMIKLNVIYPETDEHMYDRTEATLVPVNLKLISGGGDGPAKAVTVVEPTGKTVAVEGGSNGSYDLYLRPCTEGMRDIQVSIEASVLGQVSVSEVSWDSNCKATITVTAEDDDLSEGVHYLTLQHTVKDSSGNDIILTDNSILYAANVLVEIHDNEVGSVIVTENLGSTSTAETPEVGELAEDTYMVRLSKAPQGEVIINMATMLVETDRYTFSTRDLDYRDYGRNEQIVATPEFLTFNAGNWDQDQEVTVSAIMDNEEEGRTQYFVAPQPSHLSYIQGPVIISAVEKAEYPNITDPLGLPIETDTEEFLPPANGIFDEKYKYMDEAVQMDYIEIYNLDVRGEEPSSGILTDTTFTGFNMAQDISINGKPQPDGITYGAFEVVEIFLGDGSDNLLVENVTEALHFVDLRGGDDYARVKTVDGPFIMHGGFGSDTVKVTSDETKLDKIQALFGFDGGRSDSDFAFGKARKLPELGLSGDYDDDVDTLILDNTNDPGIDEVLNITRTMVRMKTMEISPDRNVLPEDSFLIKLRGAVGGSFQLLVNDTANGIEEVLTFPYPVSASYVQDEIQRVLIPAGDETNSCGNQSSSQCSYAVKVWAIGQNFAIFFVGERLNQGITLDLNTDDLYDFEPEMFQNMTNDILFRNADVVYADLENLDVYMGKSDVVVNVRGTTASNSTRIFTQGGDDSFFVSSEANQNIANAGSVDFLHGWLDYVEDNLSLIASSGRHRLMISDESSDYSKGYGLGGSGDTSYGPAELTRQSLTKIHPYVGDIDWSADGGHWSDGFNLWLGINDDRLGVFSVPSNPNDPPLRTATSIHCGNGTDIMNVALDVDEHDGAVFIANGQFGDDVIDASASSLPVILFGDGDDDRLIGGSGNDVIIGDYGRVVWRSSDNLFNPDGVIEAIAGGGGFGDFTDGVIREISDIYSVTTDKGGYDTIYMNDGDDVGIGGPFDDYISGGNERDIIFGDSANLVYYLDTTFPKLLTTINCSDGGDDTLLGNAGEVDYIVGGGFSDDIQGNLGMDLVFGDHARIDLFEDTSHKLRYATTIETGCTGGDDTINLGDGDDIAFGGAFDDVIYAEGGQDIVLGDFGYYDATEQFLPFQHFVSDIHSPEFTGEDLIYGGDGDDFLMGQENNDTIYGGAGRDDIYGGHTIRTGKDANDTLYGEEGDDAILGDNGEIIRTRLSYTSDYPWLNGMVWLNYVSPFESEVVRDIRRYDDIDYVQGDDYISGGQGNDILHGQRGDDIIFGGEGEDEVYGELGNDVLDGGAGNDIVLGDIGYAVRRYEGSGQALLQDETRGTESDHVWHKDVVLEELGNITGVDRISTKVDVESVKAEDITSASLLFVATAIKNDGTKYASANNGGWLTDLVRFNLVAAGHDVIKGGSGDDVLIGQRGDDVINTGEGSNFAIGDAGWNTIPIDTDLPRIYQIYRALKDEARSNYLVNGASDFGITFTADYELYPNQYKYTDVLSSIIDMAVNVDDVQEGSNLLRDTLGVAAISTTRDYCVQPMFRITPGFLYETQWMHGNDEITVGIGNNIVIGDDVRGFTALDLTEISYVQDLRERIGNLVEAAGIRLSTVEVDTEYFEDLPLQDFNITVASDTIVTDIQGHALVTGDVMSIMGRTVLGGSLLGNGLFISTSRIDGVLQRLYDIEAILVNLNVALFEIHNDLLTRMRSSVVIDQKPNQEAFHHLRLANDHVDSWGDNDVAVGDSSAFYIGVDRPGRNGFEFDRLSRWQAFRLRIRLRRLARSRDRDLDRHVRLDLRKSANLDGDFPYADVPFFMTVASDYFDLKDGDNMAVGDFAMVGSILSARRVPDENSKLKSVTDSMLTMRRKPSVTGLFPSIGLGLDFYTERYSEAVATKMEPFVHGDNFFGRARTNSAFGEFLTGFSYQTFSGGEARFDVDETANAYSTSVAGQSFSPDYFDLPVGAQVNGQLGNDRVVSEEVLIEGDLAVEVRNRMTFMFFDHTMVTQLKNDMWYERISERDLKGVKVGFQCTDATKSAYIPSKADLDISANRQAARGN